MKEAHLLADPPHGSSRPGSATPAPTFIVGNTAYLLANETGDFEYQGPYYGHHPEFVLKGHIRLAAERRNRTSRLGGIETPGAPTHQ